MQLNQLIRGDARVLKPIYSINRHAHAKRPAALSTRDTTVALPAQSSGNWRPRFLGNFRIVSKLVLKKDGEILVNLSGISHVSPVNF